VARDATHHMPWHTRRGMALAMLIGAAIAAFAVIVGASWGARRVLRNVSAPRITVVATAIPTATPMPALSVDTANAPGLGATQSFGGVTITAGNLRVASALDVVSAPPGQAFAIVTITLFNTNPADTITYNAANFVLLWPDGTVRHEAVAALPAPLGVGQLAGDASVAGDVAFLVPHPAPVTTFDPQILFLPEAGAMPPLRWDLALP
jgi:hypothetical protein